MILKVSKKVGTLMLTSLLCGMLFSSYSAIAYDRGENVAQKTASFKHERGNHMARDFKKMVKYLKLSEEQQEKMKSIRTNASEQRTGFKQSMKSFHAKTKVLLEHRYLMSKGLMLYILNTRKNFRKWHHLK